MPRNTIAAAVAAAAIVGGGVGAAIAVEAGHGTSNASGAAPTVVTGRANVANGDLTVGQIAKQATKSVVEVDATSSSSSDGPFPYGGSHPSGAEGTGFVYDAKGDIVTNAHVIDGASSIRVKLDDGSTVKATVVGSDISSDLAVLHVEVPAGKLQPLALADSSKVEVGEGVVAIGNPFGLDDTVTSGIVSALGREIAAPDNTPIEGAIQTDAAINHGNSGGPLLDLQGKVIGVTSQIQSDGGGNEGVGFAIPSNLVASVASQLIAGGKVQHALLGVTPEAASGGVGISSVESGSAADKAGLKVGDVITAVDGTAVTTPEKLRAIIAQHAPGDRLTLTIRRGGDAKTVQVTLGARSS